MLDPTIAAKIVNLVRKVSAKEIKPLFRNLHSADIAQKSQSDDLVTQADIMSERAITQGLKTILPSACVIGEEAVASNPNTLDLLEGSDLAIIVDPIDGTWNYAQGINLYGVLIAVVKAGVTIWGMLYDSSLDDWIETRKSGGTWFCRPGKKELRLTVNQPNPEHQLTGFVAPINFQLDNQVAVSKMILKYARAHTLRCCCHEYRAMIHGNVDFFINPKPKVWDHAAGVLAVQEAGGTVKMLDGSEYSPLLRSGVIVAGKSEDIVNKVSKDFNSIITS